MDDASARLVAEIVHDFRTPLAAIRSSTETMEAVLRKLEDSIPDKNAVAVFRDSLRTSRLACERLISLVKDVHISAQIDIHDCIENALLLAAHDLKPRITVVREYGKVPLIQGDASHLDRVIMNILVNATQAIDGEGEIRIKTWEEDGAVRVAITDNGHGIAPESQEHIFDRGFTTKSAAHGSGLGLAICQKIIHDHNGRIELKSEVGHGSTLTIILPIGPG